MEEITKICYIHIEITNKRIHFFHKYIKKNREGDILTLLHYCWNSNECSGLDVHNWWMLKNLWYQKMELYIALLKLLKIYLQLY